MKFFLVLASFLFFSFPIKSQEKNIWDDYFKSLFNNSYDQAFNILDTALDRIEFNKENFPIIGKYIQVLGIRSLYSANWPYFEKAIAYSKKLETILDKESDNYKHIFWMTSFFLSHYEKNRHESYKEFNKISSINENFFGAEPKIFFLLWDYQFSLLNGDIKRADSLIHNALARTASSYKLEEGIYYLVLSKLRLHYISNGKYHDAVKLHNRIADQVDIRYPSIDIRDPLFTSLFSETLIFNYLTGKPNIKLAESVEKHLDYIISNNKNENTIYNILDALTFTYVFSGNLEKVKELSEKFKKIIDLDEFQKGILQAGYILTKVSQRESLNKDEMKIIDKFNSKIKGISVDYQIMIETLNFYKLINQIHKNKMTTKKIENFIDKLSEYEKKLNLQYKESFKDSNYPSAVFQLSNDLIFEVLTYFPKFQNKKVLTKFFKYLNSKDVSKAMYRTNFLSLSDSDSSYQAELQRNLINEISKRNRITEFLSEVLLYKSNNKISGKRINYLDEWKKNQNSLEKLDNLIEKKDLMIDSYETFPEFNLIMKELDEGHLFYSYYVFRNYILACSISKHEYNCNLRKYQGSISNELKKKISDLNETLSFSNEIPFNKKLSKEIFGDIFDAEIVKLKDFEKLTILPPNNQLNLPFNTLIYDEFDNYLGLDFQLNITPSANLFFKKQKFLESENEYLAFGNPIFNNNEIKLTDSSLIKVRDSNYKDSIEKLVALPETKKEIKIISKLFNKKKIFLDKQSTELNLRKNIAKDQFNIIHIATHGLLEGDFNGKLNEPALVLTPESQFSVNDGILKSSEIETLNFNSDLVILSACNTAVSKINGYGSGLNSLSLSFLSSGARNLLVSQWSVSSEETTDLITSFLQDYVVNKNLELSLQNAMKKIYEKSKSPKYWAPFILISSGLNERETKDFEVKWKSKNTLGNYNHGYNLVNFNDDVYLVSNYSNKKNPTFPKTKIIKNFKYSKDLDYDLAGGMLIKNNNKLIFVGTKLINDNKENFENSLVFINVEKKNKITELFFNRGINQPIYPNDSDQAKYIINFNSTDKINLNLIPLSKPNNFKTFDLENLLNEAKKENDKGFQISSLPPGGISSDGNYVWLNLEKSDVEYKIKTGQKFNQKTYIFKNGKDLKFYKTKDFKVHSIFSWQGMNLILGTVHKGFNSFLQIQDLKGKVLFSKKIIGHDIFERVELSENNLFIVGSSRYLYTQQEFFEEIYYKNFAVEKKGNPWDRDYTFNYRLNNSFSNLIKLDKKFELVYEFSKPNNGYGSFSDILSFKNQLLLLEHQMFTVNTVYKLN